MNRKGEAKLAKERKRKEAKGSALLFLRRNKRKGKERN